MMRFNEEEEEGEITEEFKPPSSVSPHTSTVYAAKPPPPIFSIPSAIDTSRLGSDAFNGSKPQNISNSIHKPINTSNIRDVAMSADLLLQSLPNPFASATCTTSSRISSDVSDVPYESNTTVLSAVNAKEPATITDMNVRRPLSWGQGLKKTVVETVIASNNSASVTSLTTSIDVSTVQIDVQIVADSSTNTDSSNNTMIIDKEDKIEEDMPVTKSLAPPTESRSNIEIKEEIIHKVDKVHPTTILENKRKVKGEILAVKSDSAVKPHLKKPKIDPNENHAEEPKARPAQKARKRRDISESSIVSDGVNTDSNSSYGSVRKKERALLSQVFTAQQDLSRAFNTIRYMVDMQQGAQQGRIELTRLACIVDLPSQVGKVPLPLLSEISFSLDLIESHNEYLYETMMAIRSRQVILENMLSKQLNGSLITTDFTPASFLPLPTTLTVNLHNGNKHMLLDEAAADGTTSVPSIPLYLQQLQEQNRLRIIEAHLFASILSNSSSSGINDKDNIGSNTTTQRRRNITDSIKSAISSTASLPILHLDETPGFHETSRSLATLRERVTSVIRDRKLGRIYAQKELARRYLWVQRRWEKHVQFIECSNDGSNSIHTRSNLSSNSGSTAANALSNNNNPIDIAHSNYVHSPMVADASSDNTNLVGVSPRLRSSASVIATEGGALHVRSDYEQELLLKELMAQELLQTRINKGTAVIPQQLSPWLFYDTSRPPGLPQWTCNDTTEFMDPISNKPLSPIYATDLPFPAYVPSPLDVVDVTSNRLTTDGARQYCAHFHPHVACPLRCNCCRSVDNSDRLFRVWTDIEKSIFVDKFVQYPKNFSKIASYLSNKTTKDCVRFYYNSKYVLPYKQLLRECDARRRINSSNASASNLSSSSNNNNSSNSSSTSSSTNHWSCSILSAASVGSVLFPTGSLEGSTEPLVELPVDDATYHTFLLHPPFTGSALDSHVPQSRSLKAMVEPFLHPRNVTCVQTTRRLAKHGVFTGDVEAYIRNNALEFNPAPTSSLIKPLAAVKASSGSSNGSSVGNVVKKKVGSTNSCRAQSDLLKLNKDGKPRKPRQQRQKKTPINSTSTVVGINPSIPVTVSAAAIENQVVHLERNPNQLQVEATIVSAAAVNSATRVKAVEETSVEMDIVEGSVNDDDDDDDDDDMVVDEGIRKEGDNDDDNAIVEEMLRTENSIERQLFED